MSARRTVVAALVAAPALLLTACSGSSGGGIPSFEPHPGSFRIVPHPTNGAPAPQVLRYQGQEVLATLGDVTGSGDTAEAGISFVQRSSTGGKAVPFRTYGVGDDVAVGSTHVTIDAIYGSGDSGIAVDVTLS